MPALSKTVRECSSGLVAVLMFVLMSVGCSDPVASPPPAHTAPSGSPPAEVIASATPSPTTDPSLIPEDWVWVTDSRSRFELAMPALPKSASTRPEPNVPPARVLSAVRDTVTYSVTAQPAGALDALDQAQRALAQQGRVTGQQVWQGDGIGLTVATPTGEVHVRAMVADGRLYVLEVAGPSSAVDQERYFSSFSPRAQPGAHEVHAPKRRYRVQAPTRMGAWRDTSGVPPLIGHRAVLDGHQLSVSAAELVFVPDPEQSLDGSVTQMRRSMNGTLAQIDPRPFGGRPSRRVELRAGDGMYATVRLMLDGSRLLMAAVYAPSGTEAPWADAYVDSLSAQ